MTEPAARPVILSVVADLLGAFAAGAAAYFVSYFAITNTGATNLALPAPLSGNSYYFLSALLIAGLVTGAGLVGLSRHLSGAGWPIGAGWPVAAVGAVALWFGYAGSGDAGDGRVVADHVNVVGVENKAVPWAIMLMTIGAGLVLGAALTVLSDRAASPARRCLYAATLATGFVAEFGYSTNLSNLRLGFSSFPQWQAAAVAIILVAIALATVISRRRGPGYSTAGAGRPQREPAPSRSAQSRSVASTLVPLGVMVAAAVALLIADTLVRQVVSAVTTNSRGLTSNRLHALNLLTHDGNALIVLVIGAALALYAAKAGGAATARWVFIGLGLGLLRFGSHAPLMQFSNTGTTIVIICVVSGAAVAYFMPIVPWDALAILTGGVALATAAPVALDQVFREAVVPHPHQVIMAAAFATALGAGLVRACADVPARLSASGVALGFVAFAVAGTQYADSQSPTGMLLGNEPDQFQAPMAIVIGIGAAAMAILVEVRRRQHPAVNDSPAIEVGLESGSSPESSASSPISPEEPPALADPAPAVPPQ